MNLIKAAKQAQEALEDTDNVLRNMTGGSFAKIGMALDALRTAIADAERAEPVAWLVYSGVDDMRPHYPAVKNKEAALIIASELKSVTEVRPLYAHPPAITEQRPPTPVGWSDTDWLAHLEKWRQELEIPYHKGPLPERGWD